MSTAVPDSGRPPDDEMTPQCPKSETGIRYFYAAVCLTLPNKQASSGNFAVSGPSKELETGRADRQKDAVQTARDPNRELLEGILPERSNIDRRRSRGFSFD